MKSFHAFIQEARTSLASQQALQMGLQSSGHGDYYDSEGRLVAKTYKGRLKFFRGKRKKARPTVGSPVQQQITQAQPLYQPTIEGQPETQTKESVHGIVIAIGRFNPPAKGHDSILKHGLSLANINNYDYRVYPSRVVNKGTDPLGAPTKIQFMKMMFPYVADYIVDNDRLGNIFEILSSLYGEKYRDVKIIVGAQRVGEFQSLVHRKQGQLYNFDNLEVLSAPGKDADSDTEGPGTSVALRTAAADGNFNSFSVNLPQTMNIGDKKQLFSTVSSAMQVREDVNLWEISPDLDKDGLRRSYKENNLYPIGSLVENVNTGLRGRVMRRGTNHLICVTNEGEMFKNWISSVHLLEDVYEVGTDKYRTALQKNTPLHPVGSYTGVKIKETVPKIINKLKKN